MKRKKQNDSKLYIYEGLPEDTIIDLSQPGVIHYMYPTGRKVPEHMMNPHIGGWKNPKSEAKSRRQSKLKLALRPYKAQFKRSPTWVKIMAIICITYIMIPIDLFDILFPWMAYSDDIFIAGILLKLLHKYGGLPEEDRTTPIELIKSILGKDK